MSDPSLSNTSAGGRAVISALDPVEGDKFPKDLLAELLRRFVVEVDLDSTIDRILSGKREKQTATLDGGTEEFSVEWSSGFDTLDYDVSITATYAAQDTAFSFVLTDRTDTKLTFKPIGVVDEMTVLVVAKEK